MEKPGNLRVASWEVRSNLSGEEIATVKDVASSVLNVLKDKGISHHQAVQVLELAKVLLGEEVV